MKPLNSNKTKWAHIVCVNWTPEIWFADDNKHSVHGQVSLHRFDLVC
jgi:hypothetical protein